MSNVGRHREFSAAEGLAFCLSMIGVQLYSEFINQWGTYFYSPAEGSGRVVFVSIAVVGTIFAIGTIWDAIANPIAGVLSDRTPSAPGRFRFPRIRGRRRPYIFWGSLLMVATSIGFWFPPVQGTSDVNFWYATAVLCVHNTLFALVVVPLLALGPEIARSEQARMRLGTWIAVGMLLGLAMANVLSGVLISLLGEPGDPGAYRKAAVIYAAVATVCFMLPVLLIRERFDGRTEHRAENLYSGFVQALQNRPFVIYTLAYFFFTAGFLAVQRVLPYWAEVGLGGTENTVTLLMLPFLATALTSAPLVNMLCGHLHIKWITFLAFMVITLSLPMMYVIGSGSWDTETKTGLGALLFAFAGIGQGIMYVIQQPMIGEMVDYDEKLFGQRREALFNGLANLAWKVSMAVSIYLATQSMAIFGNSTERPEGIFLVGPVAGVLAFVGAVIILFYPRLTVTDKLE